MSIVGRSARNFSAQSAAFLVIILERIVLTGILIRAWGVDLYSDWVTITAATGMLVLGDLGFQTYLGTMLSRAQVRGRTRSLQRLAALGIFFYLCTAALLLAGLVLVVLLGDVRSLLNLHGQGLAPVILLLGIQQTLKVSRSALVQIFRGMGDYHMLTWADVRTMATALAAAVVAVLLGAEPFLVAALYLVVELLVGIVVTALQVRRRYDGFGLIPRRPSRKEVRRAGGALRWYGVFQVVTYSVTNLPVLVIAWLGLSGPALVMFVVQRTLVNIARTVAGTMSQAAGVELALLFETADRRGYQMAVRSLARLNAAVAATVAAGLLVFGDSIVALWTGEPELGSTLLLLLLLLPLAALAPATPLQMLSIYTDRVRQQAIASGAQAVIAICGAAVLGWYFGILGVAAALALGEIIGIAILGPLLTARSLDIRYAALALGAWLTFAAGLLWSGLVAHGIETLLPGSGPANLGASILMWGLVGALPVLWLGLPVRVQKYLLQQLRDRFG